MLIISWMQSYFWNSAVLRLRREIANLRDEIRDDFCSILIQFAFVLNFR